VLCLEHYVAILKST